MNFIEDNSSVLALDVGDRRIGVACSDPTGLLASPVGVIHRTTLDQDVAKVIRAVEEREARTVVVGLPVNMNGSEGSQAEKTRSFASALTSAGLEVELWDERLTTVEATRMLQERGVKRQHIDKRVDEIAATLILEGYLRGRGPRRRTASGEVG